MDTSAKLCMAALVIGIIAIVSTGIPEGTNKRNTITDAQKYERLLNNYRKITQ